MDIKLRKLIIIVLSLLFVIMLLNIFTKGIKKNNSDITNMNILNYIPSNYDLTILSNSTNNNIKRYINENISEERRDELKMIKESIISYLGFNLKERIENIYDNEIALTFFENKLNKFDTLLIFKLKPNKDINDIINISEELSKSDEIIELNRSGKLNYISYIFQTKDNYIIASSNKKLINNSLQLNNSSKIFSKNMIPDYLNFGQIKLLSIVKNINPQENINTESESINKIVTIINSEENEIKLRSFSQNIRKINTKIINNQIDNIKDIIFTNNYSQYEQNIDFLYNDINQKEVIEKISQEVNEKLLLITNNNNWVLCFKSKYPNAVSIDKFNSLKNYNKEDLYFKNINYSIFTNERLKTIDDNITYEKKSPIFSLQDEENTYISNNFNALLNITKNTNISDQYLNDSDINTYKYILNDKFFIKEITNDQLIKYYKYLKNLQYFFNTELFSFEDLKLHISQIIPELHETVYLESNIKIF